MEQSFVIYFDELDFGWVIDEHFLNEVGADFLLEKISINMPASHLQIPNDPNIPGS
ncbi:MAG: hypothetical protein QNI92_17255 [Desulfobacterales bacterium]|nr:hypothetical protein [Desulfobacterales bacterium]